MTDWIKKRVRKISKDMILINIGIVLLGLFLVLNPGGAKTVICRLIGGIIAAWGVFKIFEYLVRKRRADISVAPLVGGCILLAIGVSVLIAPQILAAIVTISLSVILFLGAVSKLQYAVTFVQSDSSLWWVQTIGAILLIITSVISFINPFGSAGNLIMIFMGAALMVDGIWDLLTMLYISKVLKKVSREVDDAAERASSGASGRYIETTAEDVTDSE